MMKARRVLLRSSFCRSESWLSCFVFKTLAIFAQSEVGAAGMCSSVPSITLSIPIGRFATGRLA